MSKISITTGSIQIGTQEVAEKPNTPSDLPFHALILGGFSGHQTSTFSKPKIIDRDNFDEVLQSISPTLTLSPTGDPKNTLVLTFKELEEFEPDFLFESLDIFSELRSLRRKLANNATFEAAAKEMNAWHSAETIKKKSAPEVKAEVKIESNARLLDAMLTETSHRQEENIAHAGENLAQSLIQQVVAPYVIPGTHPQQAELLATIDDAISGLMNNLLHHADFQALESSWRSLYASVKKIKTNRSLKLYIANISKDELIQNTNSQNLTSSNVYKNLIEPYTDISGCIPWSVIVGDYYFGHSVDDILLLERLGLLAQHSNATFIAAAKPTLVGCDNIGETPNADDWNQTQNSRYEKAWEVLRHSPQAANIALTFPRTLSRLPYGEKTKPIEEFSFEEMKGSEHDNYLWANGAYSVLFLLADAFEQNGWQFTPGENNEINYLPSHSFEQDGDVELKPCAEIYLTEKGGERALENGLLPIWSILRSNSIRIGPFSSLHSSNQRITGKWSN